MKPASAATHGRAPPATRRAPVAIAGLFFVLVVTGSPATPASVGDEIGTSVFAPEDNRRFGEIVEAWNADILWEPAAVSQDPITKFGDEARAVFGPIPPGDCNAPDSRRLILEVDGNSVDLAPNLSKPGFPLEFEHRDVDGNLVRRTTSLPKCDKPSLAASAYCAMNSRLAHVSLNHVSWTFLCRKSSSSLEVDNIEYWRSSDPRFALYGAIGFNDLTGEIAFIDGRKDRDTFDWSTPFVPPGGQSYSDVAGRASARELYDKTFKVDCHACHDNKKPYVIDPHVKQARVAYASGDADGRAAAFAPGKFLPGRTARAEAPFRVIGSGYTAGRAFEMTRAKAVGFPGHPCTSCHSLTTLETGRRFAADAVGKMPTIARPTPGQLDALFEQKVLLTNVKNHRTDWALRSGTGKLYPWMPPANGGELSTSSPEISDEDWNRLSQCIWDAGGEECGYQSLYTACPAPDKDGDGFDAKDFTTEVNWQPQDRERPALRLKWRYWNGYGEVPTRDDVRFNVAVIVTDLPPDARLPFDFEFPPVPAAKGSQFTTTRGEVGVSGSAIVLKNASFAGHKKWTDPSPAIAMRDYAIDVPAVCGKRYLFRVLPKRFCFDYSGIVYGSGYTVHADIACGGSASPLKPSYRSK